LVTIFLPKSEENGAAIGISPTASAAISLRFTNRIISHPSAGARKNAAIAVTKMVEWVLDMNRLFPHIHSITQHGAFISRKSK
jgi:hypothetical protein